MFFYCDVIVVLISCSDIEIPEIGAVFIFSGNRPKRKFSFVNLIYKGYAVNRIKHILPVRSFLGTIYRRGIKSFDLIAKDRTLGVLSCLA